MLLACSWGCQKYSWLHKPSHLRSETTEFQQIFQMANNVYLYDDDFYPENYFIVSFQILIIY